MPAKEVFFPEEGRVEGAVGPAPGCLLWKGTGTARGAERSPGVEGRARARPRAAGGDVTAPGLVLGAGDAAGGVLSCVINVGCAKTQGFKSSGGCGMGSGREEAEN